MRLFYSLFNERYLWCVGVFLFGLFYFVPRFFLSQKKIVYKILSLSC